MARFHECDQCGERLSPEDVYPCAILSPRAERTPPQLERYQSFIAMMNGARQIKPEEERFEFCAECALALILALKQRQKDPFQPHV